MDRRHFLGFAIGSGVVQLDELRGIPHFKLSDLVGYSDERLATLVPRLVEDMVKLDIQGMLAATEAIEGFSEVECRVAQLFQGEENLAVLAAQLAKCEALSYDQAFSKCREVFLGLAARAACFPVNVN